MNKLTRIAAGIVLAGSAMASTSALAEVSYNIGYASEYHFRGILQKNSSASAGVDYTAGGIYAGLWTADVGDGLEVDVYGGYGIETESGFSLGLGFTGYYYTGDTFDDTYEEINLNLGYGIASFEYSVGESDNFGSKVDYNYKALTLTAESGIYGKYAKFGKNFKSNGDYFEVGYGTTISDIDLGIAGIFASKDLSFEVDENGNSAADESIVFSIGKSF
jgi:uncharacterized protein (TIGR02001 family)